MPLPKTTSGGLGGGGYTKLEEGQTKLAFLGDVIEGYEYWTEDNKPVRSKTKFEEPLEGVKIEKDKDGNEKPAKQRYFWAAPVYNFATESFETFQISQKGIRDELASLEANEDWGNPIGAYTITITRKGSGFDTKYSVVPNPKKDGELNDIIKKYKDSPIDLDSLFASE